MAGHDGGPGTQCRAGEHPVNEAIWPLGENHMEERRKTYLGIDIGGTEVKMGIMTAEGEILEDRSASVSFDGYRTPIIKTVRGRLLPFCANSQQHIRIFRGYALSVCRPQGRLIRKTAS